MLQMELKEIDKHKHYSSFILVVFSLQQVFKGTYEANLQQVIGVMAIAASPQSYDHDRVFDARLGII